MPIAPAFFDQGTYFQPDGSVPFDQVLPDADGDGIPESPPFEGTDAWLYIQDGQAQWPVGSPVADVPVPPSQSSEPDFAIIDSFDSFLEYTWQNFTDVDQQALCNEVGASRGLPAWALDALPNTMTDADLEAFRTFVINVCSNQPPPLPTPTDLKIPGPIDFSSPLLGGYEQNWEAERSMDSPDQLASDSQALDRPRRLAVERRHVDRPRSLLLQRLGVGT